MIDLTPLDVRNKRGDFSKALRGYDADEVDGFLQLVAERLEQLVMENLQLRERSETLQRQVTSQTDRERAVQEALVTAQELRAEMRSQAEKEAGLITAEARTEARRLVTEAEAHVRARLREAERRLDKAKDAMEELERRRLRFLKHFKQLLERELDVVEVETERAPLEDEPIELDLLGGMGDGSDQVAREARALFQEMEAAAHPPALTPHGDPVPMEGAGGEGGAAAGRPQVDDMSEPVDVDDLAPPPGDAPVDELAAAYDGGEGSPGRGPRRASDDGTLSLSFDEAPEDPRGDGLGGD